MNEQYNNLLATGVEQQLRALEMSIMEDIIRRVQKAGEITNTADWQIQRLMILGSSTKDIEDLIRRAVDGNEAEIRRIYQAVIDNEYTRDKHLYEEVGKEFLPYEQNPELQQLVAGLIQQSSDDLFNITKSTGFMLSDGKGGRVFTPTAEVYNQYLDQAITGMVSGAYDYNTLVRRMVGEMTSSGLRTDHAFQDGGSGCGVDFASGWHNRVDVAARRALLTGMSQVTGKITDLNAQRLGTNYFEVTWHGGARPDHAAWQGKVYTKEQLITICGLGTGPGLDGWNCRHSYYPFIPGISERQYTDEWLEEQRVRENTPKKFRGREYTAYEASQRQRQMETSLRAQREKVELLRQAGVDKDTITLKQCRYQSKLERYRDFSATMGLPEQMERVYTGRTKGRIAPSKKIYLNYLYQLDIKRLDAILKEEAKAIGFRGSITCDVCPTNVADYTFDDAHINAHREHGVTRAEAERFMKEATIMVERWNGRFRNYYGPNGAVYLDIQRKNIRTAFKADEYDDTVKKILEVREKNGT